MNPTNEVNEMKVNPCSCERGKTVFSYSVERWVQILCLECNANSQFYLTKVEAVDAWNIYNSPSPSSSPASGQADRLAWWCPSCEIKVDPRNVTYQERHDKCRNHVEANPPIPAPQSEAIESEVELLKSKIDNLFDGHSMKFIRGRVRRFILSHTATLRNTVAGLQAEKEADMRSFNEAAKFSTDLIASQAEKISNTEKALDLTVQGMRVVEENLTAARLEADGHATHIVELLEQIKRLENEVERAKEDRNRSGMIERNKYIPQLTAAQADIKRKDEALLAMITYCNGDIMCNAMDILHLRHVAKAALAPAQPAEVSPVTTGESVKCCTCEGTGWSDDAGMVNCAVCLGSGISPYKLSTAADRISELEAGLEYIRVFTKNTPEEIELAHIYRKCIDTLKASRALLGK